jgi:peptidoglycan/LPS O-acetylase OafA/YrhL
MNTENIKNSSKIYFENLDGLRFFAFLVVFVSHAALFLGYNATSTTFSLIKKYVLVNGDAGVSFFFVLSGFLITYLLFIEQDKTGDISLKKFYLRRILRIWPVYFTTLIVGFFILPTFTYLLIGDETLPFLMNPPLWVLPKYLFFLANFDLAFHAGASVPTDILWSISVEEQFYLIWPWVMVLLPRKHLIKFISFTIVVSCIYRYLYAFSPYVLAYSTFSVMSDLAVGSLLAWFVYTKSHIVNLLRHTPRSIIVFIYTLVPIAIFGRHYIVDLFLNQPQFMSSFATFFPLILAFLYAFIIFEQNELFKSFFKVGKLKMLSFLGKISYGFYSYHMFAFAIVLSIALKFGVIIRYSSMIQWFTFVILSFVTTLGLAVLSYNVMEKKLLKLKPKD